MTGPEPKRMKMLKFKDLAVGDEFKRRNFASHDRNPGLLRFVKFSASLTTVNCRVISDDYKDNELCLPPEENVFVHRP